MMNAPKVPGGESGLMSGTSPTHRSPFQTMPARLGSQGLPWASADARLYMMRRLAGHENPQVWYMPSPVASAVARRCALLPASVYTPECSQLPHRVEPSSLSCAKPSTCWPAVLTTLVGSLSSWRSVIALPFISFKTSARSGLSGFAYGHDRLRIGSGRAPPSLR